MSPSGPSGFKITLALTIAGLWILAGLCLAFYADTTLPSLSDAEPAKANQNKLLAVWPEPDIQPQEHQPGAGKK